MKRSLLLFVFLLSAAALLQAEGRWSFKGTVIRMKMSGCPAQKTFLAAMSGVPAPAVENCPQYTVMSDKVVYVVVGRRAEDFIPLAEGLDFLIRKNELILFSDDEKTRTRFVIQQMTLRAEWEREEARRELAARMMERSVNYESRNPPRTAMVSSSTQ
jgi:hypothetical protein